MKAIQRRIMAITFFIIDENKRKTTYERKSLHGWRGGDSGCPVAKHTVLVIYPLVMLLLSWTRMNFTYVPLGHA